MNTLLLLGIGMLSICCVSGVTCYQCVDYRRGAGCVQEVVCKARGGQKCKLEHLFMQEEPRQGCTNSVQECGSTYFDPEYGTAKVECCNRKFCNKI